jgi:CheY-like chemotaxis protein
VRRGADLTQRLLAAGRQQFLDTVDLDLNQLIEQEVQMLRRLIPESITVDFRPEPDLPAIRADRGQLLQVLMNLCVNARDAMPGGGRITISTRQGEAEDSFRVAHRDARGSRFVCLSLSDTGVGMSRETRERAFEPFFTTKGTGKGTGLGLATVYGIVSQHNGSIEVDSTPGAGTTFRIYLPALDRRAERSDSSDAVPALGRGERILVVEDDDDVRRLVVAALEELGYTALEAGDGAAALEVLDGVEVDLVLTDVVMPKMGGQELFNRCREAGREVAFVFSSGYTADALPDEIDLAGDIPFITKPYTIEKLANKIRQALSG